MNKTFKLTNVKVGAFSHLISPALGVTQKLSLHFNFKEGVVKCYAANDLSFVKSLTGVISDFAVVDGAPTENLILYIYEGSKLLSTMGILGDGCSLEFTGADNPAFGMVESRLITLRNADDSLNIKYGCTITSLGYTHYDDARVAAYKVPGDNPVTFDLGNNLLGVLLKLGSLDTFSDKSHIDLYTKEGDLYASNDNFNYKVQPGVSFELPMSKISVDSLQRLDRTDYSATISTVTEKGITKLVATAVDKDLTTTFSLATSVQNEENFNDIKNDVDSSIASYFPEDN